MVKNLAVQASFPAALFPREEGGFPAAVPAPAGSAGDRASAASAGDRQAAGDQAGHGNP